MRSVKITLAVGLASIAVALVVVLSQSPLTVVATNSVPAKSYLEFEKGGITGCQVSGVLPRGISAIRIAVEARAVGPEVSVKVFSGSRLLTEGHQAAGWGTASSVTVPVGRVDHAVAGARICTTFGPVVEPFRVYGTQPGSTPAVAGTLHGVALRMEYMRPGQRSWWSLSSSIAHHMGLGRAPGGTWIAFLALALMLVVSFLATRLALRELR